MTNLNGEHVSHTLLGGEIVYLVKNPEGKWKILNYECRQNVRVAGPSGELLFEYMEGLPSNWKDKVFNTSEAAVDFVQQEISEGKVQASS